MRPLAVALIRIYQLTLSPWFRGACRHSPSCSEFAREAIEKHGWRGVGMAMKRLARCHPLGSHGYDPVP
jgi:putative membrane protein insertion efficiency factor